MSTSEQILLSLLAHELFGGALPDTSSVDWFAVYRAAQRHAVTPLLYPAVKKMEAVPADVLNRFRGAAIYSVEMSERMLNYHQEVIELMKSKHIPCGILKGMSVARLYPHPELRLPGDVDLLIDPENLREACAAMAGAGYVFSHNTDKHYCYHRDGISVEVHHAVSEFLNNEKGNYAREYMRDALKHTQWVDLDEIVFPVLSGAYQLVSLLAHMEHHLTSFGIGLRQFCDWATTVDALRDRIGDSELALLDHCGLLEFAKVSTKLCEKYLGLPPLTWSAEVSEELADALMLDLLESGNFHAQSGVRPFVSSMTDAYNTSGRKKHSVLRSYLKYVGGRLREAHPQRTSPLWVAAFGVFYPTRWTVRMLLGKRRRFDLKQSVRTARKREKMLQGLKLYK